MPIDYSVSHDGHFIHAVASGSVTGQEFVEYEVAHATDKRIVPPASELIEFRHDALRLVTADDVSRAIAKRAEVHKQPVPHRCAIVVAGPDDHAWNLAKLYEGMAKLHYPEVVIVFGDSGIARTWLGVEDDPPGQPAPGDTG